MSSPKAQSNAQSSRSPKSQRRFTGQTLDSVAGGLYFYNARYYDPTLARFIQADTIVPQPGDPQSLNRYSYVGNKPLRYTDPSGHAAVCGTSADGSCGDTDVLHNIESQLLQGRLDPIGAKQAYYQYYREHPGESVGAYQPLNPTEEFNGIISTGYAQAQAELGAANLGGVALGAATTNGVIFEAMSGYGGNAAHGIGVLAASAVGRIRTDMDLHAFGSRAGPRPPRPGKDIFPDVDNMLAPQNPPFPDGASTFSDPSMAPLTGHYHRLPRGTELPLGLNVVADGLDVNLASGHPPTHHTIFNTVEMAFDQFIDLFGGLPWQYGGNKK